MYMVQVYNYLIDNHLQLSIDFGTMLHTLLQYQHLLLLHNTNVEESD